MTCSLCDRVALYQVRKKGYCARHRDEAYADAQRLSKAVIAHQEAYVGAHRRIGGVGALSRTKAYRQGTWSHR